MSLSNLDATAINQIHALISAQGVNEIISNIGADAVALPENFRIHDLEKFNLNRFRFRGELPLPASMTLPVILKILQMKAPAALSMPIICEPSVCLTWVLLMNQGYADNTATLKLKKTAPFLLCCLLMASVTPKSHWQNGLKTGPTTLWALMLMVTPFRQPKRLRRSVKSQSEANQTAEFRIQ